MRLVTRKRHEHPYAQHIGNARGRIAVWLDESEAIDLAEFYGPGDEAHAEIMAAVERAYPKVEP